MEISFFSESGAQFLSISSRLEIQRGVIAVQFTLSLAAPRANFTL